MILCNNPLVKGESNESCKENNRYKLKASERSLRSLEEIENTKNYAVTK